MTLLSALGYYWNEYGTFIANFKLTGIVCVY